MSIAQVLRILYARAWVIVVTMIVGVLIAVTVVYSLQERYTAQSSIILEVGEKDPITGAPMNTTRTYIRTQVRLVQSKRVAEKVVDRLDLTNNNFFRNMYLSSESQTNIRSYIAARLSENVRAVSVGGSEIMAISYTSPSPTLSASVANGFAQAFLQVDLELRVDPARRNAQWFAAQLNKLRQNLTEAEEELTDYQKEVGIVTLDAAQENDQQKIQNLEERVSETVTELSDLNSRVKEFQVFGNSGGNIDSLPSSLMTAELANLRSELGNIDAAIATISGRVGENHPQYKAIMERRSLISERLNTEISNLRRTIDSRLQIAEARLTSLTEELQREKTRTLNATESRNRLEALLREVEIRKAEYDNAFRRAGTYRLEGDLSQTGIAIVEEAAPPTSASFPRKTLAIGVAIVGCMVLGVGLAFLLEMIERRIRSTEDLLQVTDLEVLASIIKSNTSASKYKKKKSTWSSKHSATQRDPHLNAAE